MEDKNNRKVIINVPAFNLQYAFTNLWNSVPPEKTSARSKELFEQLCNSLEHDYGGDPDEPIKSEYIVRIADRPKTEAEIRFLKMKAESLKRSSRRIKAQEKKKNTNSPMTESKTNAQK